MPQLEQARDDKGRATAGVPSLSSEKRREITETQLLRIYQRECAREYAQNEANALADDNGADTTSWEQMVGLPLIGARIITRLRRLNSNLWFEASNSDHTKTGVYILKNDFKGGQTKEFICGMETELNPEFSVRVTDEAGKAKGIISGWRRVLMRLIRGGFITEPGAFALFGPPSRDSENWARYTQ